MKRTRIAVVLLVGVLVVSVLAFAMPTSTVPVAEAADAYTFTGYRFTGHVFVGGMPVPCNTLIQVLQGGTPLGETHTGIPCPPTSPPRPAAVLDLDDNEYRIEISTTPTIVEQARAREDGTANFRIGWDCGGGVVLLMAVETAAFDLEAPVIQDLHSSCPVGGIIEPVDLLEQSATSGEPSDGASASTFIALGIGIAVLLAALIVWSVRRRRVA
ncbi:MAG TPA: hypothetical protein VMX96_06260 [Dehalococcoidia bacterium]|nr:hypothetical protein [Dehalococcoidia bacterium]